MSTGSGFWPEGQPGDNRPPPQPDSPSGDETFADVLNGFGMNSGLGGRKRKKSKTSSGEGKAPMASPAAHAAPEPFVPYVEPDAVPATPPVPEGGLFDGEHTRYGQYVRAPGDDVDDNADDTAVVRPYALTGGRTKANHPLELETLISATEGAAAAVTVPEQFEHRAIVEECRTPRSVAEIAATLRVPFGVARVLVSDVADAGLVTVHKTMTADDGDEAHLMLMERVLSGLRRL